MALRHHTLASLLLLASATSAAAQRVDYARAEQYLDWNTSLAITGDDVTPRWMPDGNRFWYRSKTPRGAEFVMIDPDRNARTLVFDNVRLAAAMSVANDTSYDPAKLPFREFEFGDDGANERVVEFNASKRRFACDVASYRCTVGDTLAGRVRYVRSPDKRWEAFVAGYNLWVRPASCSVKGGACGDSTQLTTDGVRYWAYGENDPRPGQIVRKVQQRPALRWSPDSKRIAVSRVDERAVARMHLISYTSQRPRSYSYPYPLPGDTALPIPAIHVIDVATKSNVKLQIPAAQVNVSLSGGRDSLWNDAGTKLHFTTTTRGPKSAQLMEGDPATGATRVVAKDTAETWVDLSHRYGQQNWHASEDGGTIVWWSQRDGWAHLYRFDGSGALRNQITSGAWATGEIVHVDERAGRVYFTARGRESGRNIYYPHLYAANLDGTGLTLLTPEEGYHDVSVSPSGRFLVDAVSRIDSPPVTTLRSLADGRVIRELERGDISLLREAGWTPARIFTVKARDGITDIHGLMYLPSDFDSTRSYPVIDHIYPGPQRGSVGEWSFKAGGEPRAIAELGFVVLQIDHLGTPYRSKAFHDAYYGNMGDNGLPDHVAAIKQLGARHRFMDLGRVGIYGHSGGGFASTDAMFRYADFFKVAVSSSGNHDNRSYGHYWGERYQGLYARDTLRRTDNYENQVNYLLAGNLKGKLLLMHGDMDDNVHPAMTVQVVDALIKANRAFDLIWAPNRPHSLNEPYFIRRRWDYFVTHLMGATPPVEYEIKQPVQ